jgi:hypothetical protein
VTDQKVRWVLNLMRGTEFMGRQISTYDVTAPADPYGDGMYDVVMREAAPAAPLVDLIELKEQMLALGEAGNTLRIVLEPAPVRHVVFDTGTIDGFGWSTFTVVEGDGPSGPASATPSGLANESVQVTIDPATGTYAIDAAGLHLPGCGRLVDGGDGGDTYNYSPPATDLVVDRPVAVRVEVLESGPVRARVLVLALSRSGATNAGLETQNGDASKESTQCRDSAYCVRNTQ